MRANQSAGLSREQLEAYWMPFTGNRQFKNDPRMIVASEGNYYIDAEGRKIFDSLSGLWTCGIGHNHPKISEAIAEQARTLDYAPAFQFGHPKAFELANRVKELTPEGLDYVFFTNSGSESAETSLKMARAYWRQKGQPTKTKLIGRAKGYHGVNFGGISVGGIGANRKLYGQAVDADHLSHTLFKENAYTQGLPEYGTDHLIAEFEELIALHDASNIAALIIEPVAGSAGVIVPPKDYLKRVRELCDKHNILLIFDEVITAFGRMGSMTGAEEFGVTPDILNMAKQITNGVIPMGAVITSAEIYDTFMAAGGPEYMVELPHGYTYSGHPIACAAGLASLEILEQEQLPQRVKELSGYFGEAVHSLKGSENILDIRNYGFAAGITLASYPGEPARRPYEVAMKAWEKGVYLRFGGDCVAMGLPFTTEKHEIDMLVDVLRECIA